MSGGGSHPYYEVHGGDGPFLLLVHGFLSSRAQWLPNLTTLSEVARPVVIELYGHGRSPSPTDPAAYTPQHYVAEFEYIRAALGAERWLICGQSLGAALTFRYALDHPERVIAQVCTNSMSAFAEDDWSERVRPGLEAQARHLESDGRRVLDEHPLNPVRNRRLSPELRAAFAADVALLDPGGIARTGLYTVPGSSVRDRVTANTVPTLLVVGGREKRFAEYRHFAEVCVPLLRSVAADGGHAVNLDAPDGFNAAVTAFVSEQVQR
jgi:pimeloyl-ACP methyl ester carboxylesterase